MALKDIWIDKQNLVDIIDATDINLIAHSVINLEDGGVSIVVDDKISSTSTNPVQNKIITNYINANVSELADDIIAISQIASEALSVAKGANQALAYDSYEDMYNSFVSLCSTIDGKNKYPVGNNVFIKTLNVPDLWISAIRDDVAFDCIAPDGSFCGDDGFVSLLKNEGECQIGYYVFSPLETQKVDLSEYATIDYVDNALGSIEVALDNIITVQNELIGGESV